MNLYLAILNFRSPPFHLSFSRPNVLESNLMTLDGGLAFADYYISELKQHFDWRQKYLLNTLTKEITDNPAKEELVSSYLMPAIRNELLSIFTPYNTELVFKLNGLFACLVDVKLHERLRESPTKLAILKRSTLSKVFSAKEAMGIEMKGRVDGIEVGRGGHKDVFCEVRIKRTNLLWASIVKARDAKQIEQALEILGEIWLREKTEYGLG